MSAVISPCGLYRYRLDRVIERRMLELADDGVYEFRDKVFAFFGINPSTADASVDDATVRKWTGFCKRWGASRYIVGNVSAYRATDVKMLAKIPKYRHIDSENTEHIVQMACEADILVPCWGDRAKVPRSMHDSIDELLRLLRNVGRPVVHFGLTKGGDPKHPLMLGYDTPLVPFDGGTHG